VSSSIIIASPLLSLFARTTVIRKRLALMTREKIILFAMPTIIDCLYSGKEYCVRYSGEEYSVCEWVYIMDEDMVTVSEFWPHPTPTRHTHTFQTFF